VIVEIRRSELQGRKATLWNREHKIIRPPMVGRWSLYLDGSMTPKVPLRRLIEEEWLRKHEMAAFRHPHRSCVYAEVDACVSLNKISPEDGEKARAHLQIGGMPKDWGLWAGGILARRTRGNVLATYISSMWLELVRMVSRDQIWLPFLLWKIKGARERVFTIDDELFNSKFFTFRRHKT